MTGDCLGDQAGHSILRVQSSRAFSGRCHRTAATSIHLSLVVSELLMIIDPLTLFLAPPTLDLNVSHTVVFSLQFLFFCLASPLPCTSPTATSLLSSPFPSALCV